MMDRELMQQALDALEYASDETKPEGLHGCDCLICEAIPALRDRLAQPEKEPVAWSEREIQLIDGMIEVQLKHARTCDSMANRTMADKQKGWDLERVTLLEKIKASAPPQRQWVGLTDEDIFSVLTNLQEMYNRPPTTDSRVIFAYAIERKLKEKNDR